MKYISVFLILLVNSLAGCDQKYGAPTEFQWNRLKDYTRSIAFSEAMAPECNLKFGSSDAIKMDSDSAASALRNFTNRFTLTEAQQAELQNLFVGMSALEIKLAGSMTADTCFQAKQLLDQTAENMRSGKDANR